MITCIPREISDPGLITKHFQYTCFLSSQVESCLSWKTCVIYDKALTNFLQIYARAQSVCSLWFTPFAPFTSEAYPSCTVTDIRFCFDVHKLMRLDLERYSNSYKYSTMQFVISTMLLSEDAGFFRRKAMKGRLYFATKAQKEGKIMIKTHACAQIFCCDICGFEKVHFLSENHILSLRFVGDFLCRLCSAKFCCTERTLPLDGTVIQM